MNFAVCIRAGFLRCFGTDNEFRRSHADVTARIKMTDIIIVTRNAQKNLIRCLASLKKYTSEYCLTIVDNDSRDGTRRYLRTLKGVRVIYGTRNLGFSRAAEIALAQTACEFVVFLDDDARVTRDWLTRLYSQMRNPRVGIVGCKIVTPDNRLACSDFFLPPARDTHIGEMDRGQKDYIRTCDALVGTCWLVRRSVFGNVGSFDRRFFPAGYEDIDYCLRARLAGYALVYNGEVKIVHDNLNRWSASGHYTRNLLKFNRKWRGALKRFPLADSHVLDSTFAQGLARYEDGHYRQALSAFGVMKRQDKRFSVPFYTGLAYEGLNLNARAVRSYKIAVAEFEAYSSINPLRILAYYRLSRILRKMGKYHQSLDWAKKMLRMCAGGFPHKRGGVPAQKEIIKNL